MLEAGSEALWEAVGCEGAWRMAAGVAWCQAGGDEPVWRESVGGSTLGWSAEFGVKGVCGLEILQRLLGFLVRRESEDIMVA